MAEFCLKCFNQYCSDEKVTEKDVIMDIDFCEECKEWKPCVIVVKEKNIFKRLKNNVRIFVKRFIFFFK